MKMGWNQFSAGKRRIKFSVKRSRRGIKVFGTNIWSNVVNEEIW